MAGYWGYNIDGSMVVAPSLTEAIAGYVNEHRGITEEDISEIKQLGKDSEPVLVILAKGNHEEDE